MPRGDELPPRDDGLSEEPSSETAARLIVEALEIVNRGRRITANRPAAERVTRAMEQIKVVAGEQAAKRIEFWMGQLKLAISIQDQLVVCLRSQLTTGGMAHGAERLFVEVFKQTMLGNTRQQEYTEVRGQYGEYMHTYTRWSSEQQAGETYEYRELARRGSSRPDAFSLLHTLPYEAPSLHFRRDLGKPRQYVEVAADDMGGPLLQIYVATIISDKRDS